MEEPIDFVRDTSSSSDLAVNLRRQRHRKSTGCSELDIEQICGVWSSKKGEVRVSHDPMTNKLAYEEPLGEGVSLHGFLERREVPPDTLLFAGTQAPLCWQAEVSILEDGAMPWYGPSFGERPKVEGEVQVLLRIGESPLLETRIRIADEGSDWEEPTTFQRLEISSKTRPRQASVDLGRSMSRSLSRANSLESPPPPRTTMPAPVTGAPPPKTTVAAPESLALGRWECCLAAAALTVILGSCALAVHLRRGGRRGPHGAL